MTHTYTCKNDVSRKRSPGHHHHSSLAAATALGALRPRTTPRHQDASESWDLATRPRVRVLSRHGAALVHGVACRTPAVATGGANLRRARDVVRAASDARGRSKSAHGRGAPQAGWRRARTCREDHRCRSTARRAGMNAHDQRRLTRRGRSPARLWMRRRPWRRRAAPRRRGAPCLTRRVLPACLGSMRSSARLRGSQPTTDCLGPIEGSMRWIPCKKSG